MTYRELLEKISKMDPTFLDHKVTLCTDDDEYSLITSTWIADGAEEAGPESRRPVKGQLVLCQEEFCDEDEDDEDDDYGEEQAERAMLAGMSHGTAGYNEAMGYDLFEGDDDY
jgi:hypothetical protein